MKKWLLFVLLSCLALSSCKTIKEIEYVYRDRTDTLYQYRNIHDSIYVADTLRMKGDTVFSIKYKYVYRTQNDTVYQSKTDSLVVYKQNTEYVKYIPKAYKWGLGISISLLIILIAYCAIKLYARFRV